MKNRVVTISREFGSGGRTIGRRLAEEREQSPEQRLRDKGVLVRWFDRAPIRDYLRVTVGSEEEMAAFVRAVEEIIREEAQ